MLKSLKYCENNVTIEQATMAVVLTNCKDGDAVRHCAQDSGREGSRLQDLCFLLFSPVPGPMRRTLWRQDLGNAHLLGFTVLHPEGPRRRST